MKKDGYFYKRINKIDSQEDIFEEIHNTPPLKAKDCL
jgi:hypothetical protein